MQTYWHLIRKNFKTKNGYQTETFSDLIIMFANPNQEYR